MCIFIYASHWNSTRPGLMNNMVLMSCFYHTLTKLKVCIPVSPCPLPVCPHDDVIKWKHFPRYRPFLRGIHRWPVNSPLKSQWRGALMFSLICVWTNGWENNRDAGDWRRHRTHYDVIVTGRNRVRSVSSTRHSPDPFHYTNLIKQVAYWFFFKSKILISVAFYFFHFRLLNPLYDLSYDNDLDLHLHPWVWSWIVYIFFTKQGIPRLLCC